MVSERDIPAAIGSTAYGNDGESVGTVESFYTDDHTGATTWVAVSSGLLGTRRVIAPAQDAAFVDGRLQLTVPSGAVSRAPRLGGEHLAPEDEEALRRHYAQRVTPADDDLDVRPSVAGAAAEAGTRTPSGEDVGHGDEVGHGDGSMVRSEEQLRVRTERVADRRVRVVKYVVTEEVQVTVPVRREEVRIEEIPLDAAAGPDTGVLVTEGEELAAEGPVHEDGGLPDEIVLHAERPVVTVEVVPVERVRLRVDVVAGQESVTESVRREQVSVDQVSADRKPADPERADPAR